MINLAEKYESKIQTKWQKESFLAGKVNTEYDFLGVNVIHILSPVTVAIGDYTRSGSNRFGTPAEMQDERQTLTLTQDKAFTLVIDKANNSDQLRIKEAGKMMDLQMKEQMRPFQDKYALKIWCKKAGKVAVISAPATSTVVGLLEAGLTELDNQMVPDENRFIYMGATVYSKLRLSTEVLASDPLSTKVFGKGIVGEFMGCNVVKVPDSYLPTGVQFLIAHKDACMYPMKLETLRILSEVAGVDGSLLEGHFYFDAFVKWKKAVGIYVGVLTANKSTAVTITPTGASHALTSSGATKIWYTIDGTDPRYSASAILYASAVTLASGVTIKAYSETTDKLDSDVASALYTA